MITVGQQVYVFIVLIGVVVALFLNMWLDRRLRNSERSTYSRACDIVVRMSQGPSGQKGVLSDKASRSPPDSSN